MDTARAAFLQEQARFTALMEIDLPIFIDSIQQKRHGLYRLASHGRAGPCFLKEGSIAEER